MNEQVLQELSIRIKNKKHLTQREGQKAINLLKRAESNLVGQLQTIGKIKTLIQQEVYRNGGGKIDITLK